LFFFYFTLVIAVLYITNYLSEVLLPFGHWFTYGLYGAICIVAAIFVWKLVPETKGKSLEDMSKLWKKD
jgi:hypothetical protein